MRDWLQANFVYISAVSSVGSLLVWLWYLQIFYREYRLARLPHLIIKQDGTFDVDSLCLVSNMSERTVDVAAVLIDAACGEAHCSFSLAALATGTSVQERIYGPIRPGSYLELRSFEELLGEAERRYGGEGSLGRSGAEVILTVRVVAFVGAQQIPRGARRRFRISFDDGVSRLRPVDLLPQQIGRRGHRGLARRWLEEAESLQRDPRGRSMAVDREVGRTAS